MQILILITASYVSISIKFINIYFKDVVISSYSVIGNKSLGTEFFCYLAVGRLSAVHLPQLILETEVFQKPFQRKCNQHPYKIYHKKKKRWVIHLYIIKHKNIFLKAASLENFVLACQKIYRFLSDITKLTC